MAERRLKLLIIDDEPAVARVFERLLAPEHDVTTSFSGSSALALIEGGRRFDAILCDVMMPGLTGMDLHARLSTSCSEQAERMIFLTGGCFSTQVAAFIARPSTRRLHKPVSLGSLLEAIHGSAPRRASH